MKKVKALYKKVSSGHRGLIILGLAAYLGILISYMWPVIPNCSTTLMGGPGDQAAFAWLYKAHPNNPFWGYTMLTNAPLGENIRQPVHITGAVVNLPAWVITKVVSPVCTYNLLSASGFIFTALITYLFVLWLTKRRSYIASWLAGYLVAFNPYLLIKTPYHLSYVFSGILVAMLWLLLSFWQRPTLKKSSLLAVLIGCVFYFDAYFVLLIAVLLGSFFIATFALAYKEHRKIGDYLRRLKLLSICIPVVFAMLLPLLYIKFTHQSEIQSWLANTRETSIMAEGRAYGARPLEYVVPPEGNPLLPDSIQALRSQRLHGSSAVETTIYLGMVPLALAVYFLWVCRSRFSEAVKRVPTSVNLSLVVGASLTAIFVAGILSLPPYIQAGSFKLHLPSELFLQVFSFWRVLARLFILVQLGVVLLASLGLAYILSSSRLKETYKPFVFLIIFVISLVEYLPYNPLHREYWSFNKIPTVYTAIKEDPSVDTIAEYPMLDPPRNYAFIFYLTYQIYHQKPMINSGIPNSSNRNFRVSLMDVNDWQTIGALKQLGVDTLLIHSNGPLGIQEGLGLVENGHSYDKVNHREVTSYRINNTKQPKSYILSIGKGFDGPSAYDYKNVDYFMHSYGELEPSLLPGGRTSQMTETRLEYYAFEKQPRAVDVKQNGQVITTLYPLESKQVVTFTINPALKLEIVPHNPPADYSFVISNMELE